jgi:hypothetical protein
LSLARITPVNNGTKPTKASPLPSVGKDLNESMHPLAMEHEDEPELPEVTINTINQQQP